MIDLFTLQKWVDKLGFDSTREGPSTLRIVPRKGEKMPPFFLQHSEHWILLSMLPMLASGEESPSKLNLILLEENREMRVAKYALDDHGDVVLCAELPTESLDYSELADAVMRMLEYARRFRTEIACP